MRTLDRIRATTHAARITLDQLDALAPLLAARERPADGYPTGNEPGGRRSTDPTSSTERAACTNLHERAPAHQALTQLDTAWAALQHALRHAQQATGTTPTATIDLHLANDRCQNPACGRVGQHLKAGQCEACYQHRRRHGHWPIHDLKLGAREPDGTFAHTCRTCYDRDTVGDTA